MAKTPPDPTSVESPDPLVLGARIRSLEEERAALEDERSRLAAEVATLRERLDAIGRAQDAQARAGKVVGSVVGKTALTFAMGLGVRRAFERLFQAIRSGDLFPIQELADLGAAIVRRMVWTQLLTAFIAVVPLLLLIQQNYLLSASNTRDAQNTRVARSTQLIELLFDETCSAKGACKPTAPPRLRSEAARAYVELERDLESGHIDLAGAHLEQVVLRQVDLSEVDFTDASMSEANLQRANLSGAILHYADLADADLTNADLVDAQLQRADLARADLRGVRFGEAVISAANFEGAYLQRADLSDVKQLRTARLEGAFYDGNTEFPRGFKPEEVGLVKKSHPRDEAGD